MPTYNIFIIKNRISIFSAYCEHVHAYVHFNSWISVCFPFIVRRTTVTHVHRLIFYKCTTCIYVVFMVFFYLTFSWLKRTRVWYQLVTKQNNTIKLISFRFCIHIVYFDLINIWNTCMSIVLPSSQCIPPNKKSQEQEYVAVISSHVPCTHGELLHSLISV